MLYRIFDFLVESEIELLDLDQVSEGFATLFVKRSESPLGFPTSLDWTDVWGGVWRAGGTQTTGRPVWRFAWQGEDLLIVVPKRGEFRIVDGFRSVICYPYSRKSDAAVQKQLSHSIIPRVLAEIGHLIVHASCVSIEGVGSLMFMGQSGAGKSTLAASFAGDGGTLVSDDIVLLRKTEEGLVGLVTGAYARLWDDSLAALVGPDHNANLVGRKSGASKWTHRVQVDGAAPRHTRVAAIFHMSSEGERDVVSISEESTVRLLALLTEGTLLLDPSGKRNRSGRFAGAGDAANACPAFYNLSYPRKFDRLPEVRRTILDRVSHASVAR